jgi:hypothetical protein
MSRVFIFQPSVVWQPSWRDLAVRCGSALKGLYERGRARRRVRGMLMNPDARMVADLGIPEQFQADCISLKRSSPLF